MESIPTAPTFDSTKKIKIQKTTKKEFIKILVIDQNPLNNYFKLFANTKLEDGTPVYVDQCGLNLFCKR
jgi:hypothetical protein